MIDSEKNKQKILKKFVEIAAISGWNEVSLNKAFLQCDIDPKNIIFIFPDSLLDVAQLYFANGNNLLKDKIAKIKDFDNYKIRDKIRLCLYHRFEIEIDNQQILTNLAKFYQDPRNLIDIESGIRPAMQSIKFTFIIADLIWHIIKDQSSDYNFYTKRIILAKIIMRSFFVFINDNSTDIVKTKEFIDMEIEKVMSFEKFKSKSINSLYGIKENINEMLLNNDGSLKNVEQLIKELPFIRLLNKKN